MSQDFINDKYNFEKKYTVHIEQTKRNFDGYEYMQPQYASLVSDKKRFNMTFYFKKDKKINPLFIIEKLDGDTFPERIDIINNFKRHHALSYAVSTDGFDELLKEEKHD